jgi:hypothetical protein
VSTALLREANSNGQAVSVWSVWRCGAEGGGVAVASAGAWAGTRANFRIGESMSSIEGGT